LCGGGSPSLRGVPDLEEGVLHWLNVHKDSGPHQCGSSNSSGVYEYQLDIPLAFQEGDIFGYFQPILNRTELQLYLENSNRITTYQQSVCVDCLFPSPVGSNFSLASALTGTSYPVIAVTTVPSDCGCGFMSVKRVRSLLSSTGRGYSDDIFRRRSSVLFPSLNFTCRVNISKWTVAAQYYHRDDPDDGYIGLHLWRKLGNLSSTLYKKVNNTVTVMSVLSRTKREDIYEFTPTTTVVAEPRDIVGLFISYSFRPLYEKNNDILFYWSRETQDEYFDILDSVRGYGSPLITIEASPVRLTSPSISPRTKQATEEIIIHSLTPSSTPESKQSMASNYGTSLIAGSAASVLVLAIAIIVLITVCVCWRKSHLTKKTRALPEGTEDNMETEHDYIQKDNMYAYAAQPTLCSATEQNVAYNAHSFDDTTELGKNDVSSKKDCDGCAYEENYDNVVPVRGGEYEPVAQTQ
ncbi:hypothetical protein GBAR_LOCUS5584, partial [Geodia barretti]